MTYEPYRGKILAKVPRWLRKRNIGRVLYVVGLHCDGLVEMASAAMKYRLPGYYGPDSLPYLGHDRKIPRGPNESDQQYAERLIGWLDTHRHRGSPREMLKAVRAHFLPDAFAMDLVLAGSPLLSYTLRFHMDLSGEITRHKVPRSEWSPHGDEEQWARWWLFFHDQDLAGDDFWDEIGTWGDGGVWGSAATPQEIAEAQVAPRIWNAARSIGRLVFLGTGEDWDTYDPGTWPRQSYIEDN